MEPSEFPHTTSRFTELLDAEIARVGADPQKTLPTQKTPLTQAEYRGVATDMRRPTPEQVAQFIAEVRDDRDLTRYGQQGWKAVPVLMPHPHGFTEPFTPERLAKIGNLYYYVFDENNCTVLPDKNAFMDAVLPPEVIANAAPLSENLRDPAQAEAFYSDFEAKTRALLAMCWGE